MRKVVAALSAGLIAASLEAQAVRGVVTLSDDATRASGVIVIATRGDTTLGRALTNQQGRFFIQLPQAGRYTLRALRIGFRPTQGPTVTVAESETVEAQIKLTDVAVSLSAVTVKEDDVCRTSPSSGALVARAWEEARKAIMASQLTATDAPLVADWVEYQRRLDATGRIVRGQSVRNVSNPTTHAFRSAPAEVLAERGYVTLDSGETTFHAPDGDALLSESFAATHCFQIAPSPRGADTLIGVGFRPAHDRADVHDIDGTFWLDRRTAELKWLDFRYLNLPSVADRAAAGGRVEFLHLGTGGWLIGSWHIRMPELSKPERIADAGTRRVIQAAPGGVLSAIQITGGEVVRVARGDSVFYRESGATLDVQVFSRDRAMPLAGATVELVGTGYLATADASGRATTAPVLEGRYSARVRTPMMDSLGAQPVAFEVEVRRDARRDSVRVPTIAELVRGACRDSLQGGSLVRGSVRNESGRPVANAAVVVAWQRDFKIAQGLRDISGSERTVGAFTNASGLWRVCGAPRDTALQVRVKTDDGADARPLKLEADQWYAAIDLVVHPVVPVADPTHPATNRALIEISVTDPEGSLVSEATLDLELPDGVKRTVITGPNGRALIPDVAAGRVVVRARKVGYKAGQVLATVAAGRNTVPIILSSLALPTLATVRIVGDKQTTGLGRLDEFEMRRMNHEATVSITRDDILKRNPTQTWQVLANIPSVKVADRGDGVVVAVSPRTRVVDANGTPCYFRVMVDGVLLQQDILAPAPPGGEIPLKSGSATDMAHLPPPDAIHGIEVFAGPSSIPLQYKSSSTSMWCGLIAIWTR